jgi:hypothetical protein
MATPFETIRVKAGDAERSLRWYRDQIRKIQSSSYQPGVLLNNGRNVKQIYPGGLYMFYYDPKHKDKLPYYDTFPLVLPFNYYNDGFIGLNLHYMPYQARFNILGALTGIRLNQSINKKSKLAMNWSALNNLSAIAPISHSVKRYLYNNVASSFVAVEPEDWIAASLLPVERFVGASKYTVWKHGRAA